MNYGITNYGRNYLREGDELLITNYPLDSFLSSLKRKHLLFQKVAKYYA